jgi:hypothetical protein
VWKGSVKSKQITFDMITFSMKLDGAYPMPIAIKPHNNYIVFLKYREGSLYLFAGVNGAIEIRDNRLIYDKAVPYYLSKSGFDSTLKRVLSGKR